MHKLKKLLAAFFMAMIAVSAIAQDAAPAGASTDVMKSDGKIFVVMVVVVIIVLGLLLYVMSIDRKISRLEKK